MGRSPCCEKEGLKKGPWTPEEDQKLLAFIEQHGHGSWRALPAKAGLQRCGKSCRLRWTNYLRPDIKRGKFSMQEDRTIIQFHALLGNRWSAIATHLPKRTDNEIKNYWNTHLKKRLTKMGIDPVTHKPKSDALVSGAGAGASHSDLSHMAQWESARLEAEARLGRDSKLGTNFNDHNVSLLPTAQPSVGPCLDVLRAWQAAAWSKPPKDKAVSSIFALLGDDLESQTSILNFKENLVLTIPAVGYGGNSMAALGGSGSDWKSFENENTSMLLHEMAAYPAESSSTACIADTFRTGNILNNHENGALSNMIMENFSDILTYNINSENQISSLVSGERSNFEENKNYWNTLLNLVNASVAGSPPVL